MEPVGKKKRRRPRREFTEEFKAEIVALHQQGERTIAQLVTDFDLTNSAVRRWITRAEADADPATQAERDAVTEKAEVEALRRENARLRQDVEILKRATAFFARETR